MSNRVKHIKDSIFWSIIAQLFSITFSFLCRVIFLRELGSEMLGLNGLFTSLIGMLNVTDLGLNTAIVYCMYKPFADGDKERINALFRLYKKLYFVVGTIVFLGGIILSFFLKAFIKDSIPDGINIYVIFWFYLLNSVFSYYLWSYKNSVFFASQRNDINNKIIFICYVFLYGFQVISLIFFKNFYLYAFILLMTSFLYYFLYSFYVKKELPWLHAEGRIEKSFYKPFFKRVLGIGLARIRNISRSGIDTVFISSFLGLSITAQYNIYWSVLYVPFTLLNAIILPSVTSSMGNYFASEDKNAQYNFLYQFTFIIFWIITLETTCFLCLVQVFIQLCFGAEHLLPFSNVICFATLFFVQSVAIIFEKIKDVLGLYNIKKYCPLIEMVINIILDYIGVRLLGIPGVILATCISILLITIPVDFGIIFKHYFKQGIFKFSINFFIRVIISIIITMISYIVIMKICLPNIIIQILVKCLLCIILPNVLILLFYCKSKYLKFSVELLVHNK